MMFCLIKRERACFLLDAFLRLFLPWATGYENWAGMILAGQNEEDRYFGYISFEPCLLLFHFPIFSVFTPQLISFYFPSIPNFVSTIQAVYNSGLVFVFGLSVLFSGKYNTFTFLLNPMSGRFKKYLQTLAKPQTTLGARN